MFSFAVNCFLSNALLKNENFNNFCNYFKLKSLTFM